MKHTKRHSLSLAFPLAVTAAIALLIALSLTPSMTSNAQAIDQTTQLAPPQATPPPDFLTCNEGTQESGALYEICWPIRWNDTMIIWSHGYVAPNQPLEIRKTFGDTSLPEAYAQLGYAFATTSVRKNGMSIREGVDDLLDLVEIIKTQNSVPKRIILHGVSLGATSAVLAMEENPTVFDGGIAMCGPNGDFQAQIDYFTDGRVLFDQFFPEILAPSPVEIPQTLIDDWETVAATSVIPALADPANSAQVSQLLSTASIPFDTAVPTTTIEAITSVLWFNVQGANDGNATLGGQAYGNAERVYAGSLDDTALNAGVARFQPEQDALDEVAQRYQTSGELPVPLVTMHTTLDPVIPFSQSLAYQAKTAAAGRSSLHRHQTFERYGHCQFTAEEVLGGLAAVNQMIHAIENAGNAIFMPFVNNAPAPIP